MRVRSLGYRTDLKFPAFEGQIVDRSEYMVIRTPANPGYYWGNYLLFENPPAGGDFQRWRDLFIREIGGPPQFEHQAFGWDSPEGEEGLIQPFLEAGFRLNRNSGMISQRLRAPQSAAQGVDIRPLRTDSDWELAVRDQIQCRELDFDEMEYGEFRRRSMN